MTTNTQTPELQVFTFSENAQPINVTMINDIPFFLAKDVCDVLGIGNPTESLRNLDEDEKLTSVVLRAGQNRNVNFVNESGLYNLIFQSRKPQAKSFRKWVTSEVLPQIRKTGSYSINGAKYKRTACHTGKGYVAKGFYTNYIDYRDTLFCYKELFGYEIKSCQYNGTTWYSLRNFLRCINNNTTAGEWAKSLQRKPNGKTFSQKFWLFGETIPNWFITADAAHLIKMAARITTHPASKLQLPFPCTLPTEIPVNEAVIVA